MKTNRLLAICILLLCMSIWSNSYGQTSPSVLEPVSATPQTDGMIRYGKYDTQLFTGKLNLTIPIYHIQDPDFDLPISLIYTADAFKPRQSSGYVGQNWFLQAGGCIHREIKGYADEGMYITKVKDVNGDLEYEFPIMGTLIYALRAPHSAEEMYPMPSNIFRHYSDMGDLLWVIDNANHEYRDIEAYPDIYHFNFCGHSGSFTINNQGKPIILSGDFVEVNLDGLGEENGLNRKNGYACPQDSSHIIIHTLDGYEYTFGGNPNALEYSLRLPSNEAHCNQIPQNNLNKELDMINKQTACVESWYLTSIKAPNGRRMNFEYCSDNYTWNFYVIPNSYSIYPPVVNQPLSSNWALQKARQALVSSITIPDTKLEIDFTSTISNKKLFDKIPYHHNSKTRLLTSVLVQCDTDTLCHVDLTYTTRTNNFQENYWHYLKDVTVSGVGKYAMEYTTGTYPHLYSPCSSSPRDNTDFHGYDKSYANLGLIERITFPTGGYQKFTFANHDTSGQYQYFGYLPNSTIPLFFAVEANQNLNIGGKRIEKVETYDRNQYPIEITRYTYSNCTYYKSQITTTPTILGVGVNLGLLISPYYKFNTHVGYKTVTKNVITSTTTDSTTYNFYTGLNIGTYDLRNSVNVKGNITTADYGYLAMSGMPFYESSLNIVGTLLQETTHIRDIDGVSSTLTKKLVYSDVAPSGIRPMPLSQKTYVETDTICLFSRVMDIASTRYLYAMPHLLIETIEDCNINGNTLQKRIGYEYDTKKRITQQLTEGSDNRKYFVRYTYPDNIKSFGGDGQGYRKMIQQKRIKSAIETIQGYRENNTDYITSGNLLLYSTSNGVLKETATLSIVTPITDYQSLPVKSIVSEPADFQILTYDERYRITCEYVFDDNLRLESIQPVGQPATTYSYELPNNGGPLMLRKYNMYPLSKTTLGRTTYYTYYPYVGIETITDENGIITHYQYDSHGRLIEVYRLRDGQKEILAAYNYNIVTE